MNEDVARERAKQALLDAEQQYQRARIDDYLTRLLRDAAMAEAHRAGLSSREISELLGGTGQPNVVRSRRRARRLEEELVGGLLSPGEAVRLSGLAPRQFIAAVHQGQITPVQPQPGVYVFRAEDVRSLATVSPDE